MATATMNTVQPVGGGLDYEKELRKLYGHTGGGTAGYQNGMNGFTGGSGFGGFGTGNQMGSTTGKTQTGTNEYINDMYDASLESQKQQLQSNYETDVSNLDAEKEKAAREHDEDLTRAYVESYKKAKNFNEVQNAYGLTSGAMGQAALAQSNQLQGDLTSLRNTQQQIDAEIERQRSILAKEYAAAIAKAQADNDFERAQALYEQAKIEEERTHQMKLQAAQFMAEYGGDFSLLAEVYGLSPSQVAALSGGGSSGSSSGGAGGGSPRTDWAILSNAERKEYVESGKPIPEGAYTKGWV